MKSIRVLSIVALVMSCHCHQLSSQTVVSPGMKLGHTFGENGGFTWGFEVSITSFTHPPYYGGVVDIDFCKERTKLHIGFQASLIAGASIGPTWIWEDRQQDVGFSVIPFAGVFLYPYYAYTVRPEKPDLQEIGSYLKIPIAINGKLMKL